MRSQTPLHTSRCLPTIWTTLPDTLQSFSKVNRTIPGHLTTNHPNYWPSEPPEPGFDPDALSECWLCQKLQPERSFVLYSKFIGANRRWTKSSTCEDCRHELNEKEKRRRRMNRHRIPQETANLRVRDVTWARMMAGFEQDIRVDREYHPFNYC